MRTCVNGTLEDLMLIMKTIENFENFDNEWKNLKIKKQKQNWVFEYIIIKNI